MFALFRLFQFLKKSLIEVEYDLNNLKTTIMIRKLIAPAFAIAFMLSLSACGGGSKDMDACECAKNQMAIAEGKGDEAMMTKCSEYEAKLADEERNEWAKKQLECLMAE